jgi:hypothetical protein
MKTNFFIPDIDKFVFVADSQNKDNFYAIPVEENEKQRTIARNYDAIEKVPDDFTVKVYRMGLVDNTDPQYLKYDIIDSEPIDFPINRIHWLFIKIINNK